MKRIILLFFVIIFFSQAFALTLAIDKPNYFKGHTIQLRGECITGQNIVVSASTVEGKKVFEFTKECSGQKFDANILIDFVDPSGQWVLKAVSGQESAQTELNVLKSRESQFFSISVLSPSLGEHFRTEDLNIAVKVTDAGRIVEDASVRFYNEKGLPVAMKYFGNGLYSYAYSIPFDAELKEWDLLVIAAKQKNEGFIGGENSAKIPIQKAKVVLEVLEPVEKNFLAKDKVILKVKALYENQKELNEPVAKAVINSEEVLLKQVSSEVFEGSYVLPQSIVEGENQVKFLVSDKAENGAEKTTVIVIQNSLIKFVEEKFLAIVLGIIAILVSLKLALYSKSIFAKKRHSKEKDEFLNSEMNELQDKYFNKGLITKQQYDAEFLRLSKELNELKAQK